MNTIGMDTEVPEERNPPNLYYFLWKKNHHEGTCEDIRIPDTVLFEKTIPTEWYFTAKDGQIMKKNANKVNKASILKAFQNHYYERKKLVENPVDVVALLMYPGEDLTGNDVTYLEHLSGNGLRHALHNRALPPYCILQKFVAPLAVYNTIWESTWSANTRKAKVISHSNTNRFLDKTIALQDRSITHEGPSYFVNSQEIHKKEVTSALTLLNARIAAHVGKTFRKPLMRSQLYWKLGRDNHIYLLYARCMDLPRCGERMSNLDDMKRLPIFTVPSYYIEEQQTVFVSGDDNCPICTKITIKLGEDFRVTYKAVIDYYRNRDLKSEWEAERAASGVTDTTHVEDQLERFYQSKDRNVTDYSDAAKLYLSQILSRHRLHEQQKGSRRKAGLAVIMGVCKDLPSVIKTSLVKIQDVSSLLTSPTFLYNTIRVCESCGKNVNKNEPSSRTGAERVAATASLPRNRDTLPVVPQTARPKIVTGIRHTINGATTYRTTLKSPSRKERSPTRFSEMLSNNNKSDKDSNITSPIAETVPHRPRCSRNMNETVVRRYMHRFAKQQEHGPKQNQFFQAKLDRIIRRIAAKLTADFGQASILCALDTCGYTKDSDGAFIDLHDLYDQLHFLKISFDEWAFVATQLNPIPIVHGGPLLLDLDALETELGTYTIPAVEFKDAYDSDMHKEYINHLMFSLNHESEKSIPISFNKKHKSMKLPTTHPSFEAKTTFNGIPHYIRMWSLTISDETNEGQEKEEIRLFIESFEVNVNKNDNRNVSAKRLSLSKHAILKMVKGLLSEKRVQVLSDPETLFSTVLSSIGIDQHGNLAIVSQVNDQVSEKSIEASDTPASGPSQLK